MNESVYQARLELFKTLRLPVSRADIKGLRWQRRGHLPVRERALNGLLVILEERKRLHIKPGLTCLRQIGGRSEIHFEQQMRLDMEYIHSRSAWQDIRTILKNIPAVFFGTGGVLEQERYP